LNHKVLPELADLCIVMKTIGTIFKYWCQYARKLEHFINTFLPQCSLQNATQPSSHVPQH